MKKRVLGIALAIISMGFVVSAEAKTADNSHLNTVAANAVPQWGRDRYDRRYDRRNDRRRTVTRSRYVRYGRRLYRETYLVTYRPNGRIVDTRLISRQRVG
ncbi:MAG TPA: hypothetical protein VFT44_02145 [Pyrinomonadaceae bacterium]|nr:hypothetical protein [Pyrinomonadaceae bacterium]